jgi:hypothetical protein
MLEKSGSANSDFFFWFEKSGWPEKKNKSLKNHFSRTTFLHLEKWLQIKWLTALAPTDFYTFLRPWFVQR